MGDQPRLHGGVVCHHHTRKQTVEFPAPFSLRYRSFPCDPGGGRRDNLSLGYLLSPSPLRTTVNIMLFMTYCQSVFKPFGNHHFILIKYFQTLWLLSFYSYQIFSNPLAIVILFLSNIFRVTTLCRSQYHTFESREHKINQLSPHCCLEGNTELGIEEGWTYG